MDTGCIPQMSDNRVPVEQKREIIDERVRMHGFQRGNVVGADGISIFDGNDYSSREYVQQAMKGNVYVSEPLVSKITGELSIMVAAPLYEGGNQGAKQYCRFHPGQRQQPCLYDQPLRRHHCGHYP